MPRKNPGLKRSQTIRPYSSREKPEYLRKCIGFLKHFAKINGLQCKLENTSVIPISGNYDINDKLCLELALSWENMFTLLRFQIDSRLKKLNVNYEKCFTRTYEISRS